MVDSIFNDAEHDLVWDVFDGDPQKNYEEIMSVAGRVLEFFSKRPSGDVGKFFRGFLGRLNALNDALFPLKSSMICCDNFDFVNLRTAVIVSGPIFYSKIINGDYSGLDECESIAGPMRKLFYEVVSALDVIVIRDCLKNIGDFDFYSDDVFIRVFGERNSEKVDFDAILRQEDELFSLIGAGEVLNEVSFKDFGMIRVGDFLRHVKLGIFWVYRMHNRPGGRIQIDAMFKEQHVSLLLVEGAGLVTRV